MARIEVRSFDSPDETRPLAGKGRVDVVSIGGKAVLRATYEPGWRWSEHVKPIARTERCESSHLLYVSSGRLRVAMDDGTDGEAGPGDVVRVEPGHDAWVAGDEPVVAVDFGASPDYGRAP
jgi:quercetin dioxygenase-like cupin family protein